MISLQALADLAREHAADLDLPVVPLLVGDRVFGADAPPLIMGCVNLSRDSTYRESIATSTEAAIRKGRVLAAQGADVIDVGAESSRATAARVGPVQQIALLVPVVTALAADGVLVSAETYDPEVAEACVEAGATMLNFTGTAQQDEVLRLAAASQTTVVLCDIRGEDARAVAARGQLDDDPVPGLLERLGGRLAAAEAAGVERIVLDPGLGFSQVLREDPQARLSRQAQVLVNTFRLRRLGRPLCHALPHAFDVFGDQFRTAEGFFAVLALLGGTSVLRTHEVPQVRAVVEAMRVLTVR